MRAVVMFCLGWTLGARAGNQGVKEISSALKTVKDSEEFGALMAIARAQSAAALHELSLMVSGEKPTPPPADLLERVKRMQAQRSS